MFSVYQTVLSVVFKTFVSLFSSFFNKNGWVGINCVNLSIYLNAINCFDDLKIKRSYCYMLRWLVPVFHARAHVRLPTREDPPARKAKQIWRRSALFAKGYLAHFQKKFVFTRDCITKKVLSYFEIWKKSASGAQCSCFRYKWALVL